MGELFKGPLFLEQLGVVLLEGTEDLVDIIVGLGNVGEKVNEDVIQLGVLLSQIIKSLLLEDHFLLFLQEDIVEVVR